MVENQNAKGLILMITESGEIMWVHHILTKMYNEKLAIPNSKASHAISSLSQQMMTLLLLPLSATQKKSSLP